MIQRSCCIDFEWLEVCDEVGRLFGGVTAFGFLDAFDMYREHADGPGQFPEFQI